MPDLTHYLIPLPFIIAILIFFFWWGRKTAPTLELKVTHKTINLKPGDILVIKTNQIISDEVAKRLKLEFESVIKPIGGRAIVLSDDLELSAVIHGHLSEQG